MTGLPDGWRNACLYDIAQVTLGQSPPGNTYNSDGRGVPFFQGKSEFTATYAEVRKYTTAGTKFAAGGDILISVRAPVGPTNIAPVDCAIGRGLAGLRAEDGLDQRYLFWALRATEHELASHGAGSTFPAITGKQLKSHRINVAPLHEQLQIVDILEDHLSRLDAGFRGLGETIERLRLLRVSSLAHNVRSQDESENDSLMFGDQALALAPGWASGFVAQTAELVEYGTSSKTHVGQLPGDVPVLRMGNVKDGRLVWGSLKYLASDIPGLQKIMLRPGDLLFNRTNSAEHVGKSAVFEGEREAAAFASYLIRVRFRPEVDPRWANMVINSPYGRAYVTSVTSQQVGQANVNGTKLKAFPLPIPPLDAQIARIGRHAETIDRADRLFDEVQRAKQRLQSLRRSLLSAAFSGRLTGRTSDMELVEEMAGV